MGVAGSGKTTIGQALAEQTGWPFIDADDYHPEENRAKMAAGRALSDEDRVGWLQTLNAVLRDTIRDGTTAILACSALAERYRAILVRGIAGVTFVYLKVTPEVALRRMQERHHFFPPSLASSQFESLEVPSDSIVVDASQPVPDVVAEVVAKLQLK
jgi:gluconokinase